MSLLFSLRALMFSFLVVLLTAGSCSMGQSPQPITNKPPSAEEKPVVDDYFGFKVF